MASARQTVVRALREIRAVDLYTDDDDVSDTLTNHGLDVLSRMMATWPAHGLRILDNNLEFTGTTANGSRELTSLESEDDLKALADIFPGMVVTGTGIPSGTKVTKVTDTTVFMDQEATAGGTVALTFADVPLDARFEDAVICMLAVRLSSSVGVPASDEVKERARDGWSSLQAFFMKTPDAGFDDALVDTQASRRTATFTGNE